MTAAFASPTPEELSRLVPAYEVLELISTGSHGSLYKAKQRSLDRAVTIKVLPPEVGQNARLREAFETEAKVMARLNHPNLVDVFDFGNVDGMLYIIMEDMPERNLHGTAQGHHVEQKESARLIANVCHGLAHAHELGIVHSRINPTNILINDEAEPKIVDFGLSSLSQSSDSGSDPMHLSYIAPEIRDGGAPADVRSDIYSVGIMLYRLLTGTPPADPYRPPSACMPIHADFDAIVAKAIQPDPSLRYQSAASMAAELEAYLKKRKVQPTQNLLKAMVVQNTPVLASAAPGVVRPRIQPTLASARSSGNGAKVTILVLVALMVAVIVMVVSSTKKDSSSRSKKTSADPSSRASATTKPNKPTPPKPNKPNKPFQSDPAPRPAEPVDNAQVVAVPKPKPAAAPAPAAAPKPTPPEKPEPPEFIREAWLANARSTMVTESRRALLEYDKDLQRNLDRFERDVNRLVRKLDRKDRKPAAAKVETAFEAYRVAGRLPEEPGDAPAQIKDLYKTALADQSAVDQNHLIAFTNLRLTYTRGIETQISQLKQEGNDDHATALEEEVALTQKEMARFMRIIRGLDPDPEPEEKKKDKK